MLLVAVHEEPLYEFVGPAETSWKTVQGRTRATLVETRDALAPGARTVVEADALVWRALRRVVRREHRDLLVVGSSRRVPAGRVGFGEDARQLFDHLECPLAIAPRGMRDVERPHLERIGVGFDQEPEARAAFALAASISRSAGAQLEVCGVVDDRVPGGLKTEQIVLGGDAIVAREASSLLERAQAAAEACGVRPRVEVSRGKPSDALRDLAARVDLLVIGSSRSGPRGRVSLGKVGSAVTDGAPCGVMIVPRPDNASAI